MYTFTVWTALATVVGAVISSCDLELLRMTLTVEHDLDRDRM